MKKNNSTIKERLSVLETLMTNHLKHHEAREKKNDFWIKVIFAPIIVGTLLLTIGVYIK